MSTANKPSSMKTVIQIRNPRSRTDCLAVVQLTASNFAAEVRGAGQTPEQYIDIETEELFRNTELWAQIGKQHSWLQHGSSKAASSAFGNFERSKRRRV